jgi:hypothetical protein
MKITQVRYTWRGPETKAYERTYFARTRLMQVISYEKRGWARMMAPFSVRIIDPRDLVEKRGIWDWARQIFGAFFGLDKHT